MLAVLWEVQITASIPTACRVITPSRYAPHGLPPGRSSLRKKVPLGKPEEVTLVLLATEVQALVPYASTVIPLLDAGTMTSREVVAVALAVPVPSSRMVVWTVYRPGKE
jgi:hypothetical protein